ncbi:Stealth CR1 domain-containing protein [Ectothiorhodospira sp. PHS-1]|uniref:Stealth CR1 domain-containing protein n=1 Tax=Ectothiorhodospira sp. PHS-1 TaxID=519989 RepID=UPI001438B575|nr:Stealth CR1 domain-containing protein [Ectothiorhodospira sp. PHS-1]
MNNNALSTPVDVVIAWVDGEDPVIQEKRNRYLGQEKNVPQVASKARRFTDNGEIKFCLQSIATHMTWVNRIFIVTDGQVPSCVKNDAPEISRIRERISIVDHSEIFAGYESLLPTFNSLAIETFIWRINDLSEHFLYLNDDFFFCGPVRARDFFRDGKVLLRGAWHDWHAMEKLSFHGENNRNGAAYSGYHEKSFFKAVHVAYPMKKSVLENAFHEHKEAFEKNAAHRFRSRGQFWPVSVHNHIALEHGLAEVKHDGKDWVHFSVAFCRDAKPTHIRKRLSMLKRRDKKVCCINYFEAVLSKVPEASKKVEKAISPTPLQKFMHLLGR